MQLMITTCVGSGLLVVLQCGTIGMHSYVVCFFHLISCFQATLSLYFLQFLMLVLLAIDVLFIE